MDPKGVERSHTKDIYIYIYIQNQSNKDRERERERLEINEVKR